MPFAAWWRGDPLPALPPLPEFTVEWAPDSALVERLTGLPRAEVQRRHANGNQAVAALLADEPAGYGWVARERGAIAELDFAFALPPGNRYLWDFATLAQYRGRGVYPHLLQAILRQESASGAERIWIGYEAGNGASARGIAKAGFAEVGDLVTEDARVTGLVLYGAGERARAFRAIAEPALLDGL